MLAAAGMGNTLHAQIFTVMRKLWKRANGAFKHIHKLLGDVEPRFL